MKKYMNHTEYQNSLKAKSAAELQYIITDCREVLKAWPDHPNGGYYLDEISYASMELKRREAGEASREACKKINRWLKANGFQHAAAKSTKGLIIIENIGLNTAADIAAIATGWTFQSLGPGMCRMS